MLSCGSQMGLWGMQKLQRKLQRSVTDIRSFRPTRPKESTRSGCGKAEQFSGEAGLFGRVSILRIPEMAWGSAASARRGDLLRAFVAGPPGGFVIFYPQGHDWLFQGLPRS